MEDGVRARIFRRKLALARERLNLAQEAFADGDYTLCGERLDTAQAHIDDARAANLLEGLNAG